MKLKNKIYFFKKSNEKNPSQPVIKITSYKKKKKHKDQFKKIKY
jgi:hypothetical protein